jgi:hypothetical protein
MYIRYPVPQGNRKLYSFWINPEQSTGLKSVKERDGIPESEQIRRAIDAWLEEHRGRPKTERLRGATRKRS